MGKAFVIDLARCVGCHNCQLACKDEHCEQPWLPYAQAQPLTGSFWMRVDEYERGQVPVVRVAYTPILCNHCERCAVMALAPDAVYRREDGLVLIDPAKAVGRHDLVDACPMGAVYWNEALELPQKCTGCAHLLDDGWTVPRCVDVCSSGALRFGEESELDLDGATPMEATSALGPKVFYKNHYRRFLAGCVYDPEANEVVIGAKVELSDAQGTLVAEQATDEFGDWKFDYIEPAAYHVSVSAEGFASIELDADVTEKDLFTGDRPMSRA